MAALLGGSGVGLRRLRIHGRNIVGGLLYGGPRLLRTGGRHHTHLLCNEQQANHYHENRQNLDPEPYAARLFPATCSR